MTDALRRAAERSVDVRLILETADSGHLRYDAADAFTELGDLVTFWIWPNDRRRNEGSALHAKAAVADARSALVTSANLTGRALEDNMELGLIVRGGSVPRRLADHFDALIASGVLMQVTTA